MRRHWDASKADVFSWRTTTICCSGEKAHLPNKHLRSAGIEVGQEPAGGDWHPHRLTLKGGFPIEASGLTGGIDAKRHGGDLLYAECLWQRAAGLSFPLMERSPTRRRAQRTARSEMEFAHPGRATAPYPPVLA